MLFPTTQYRNSGSSEWQWHSPQQMQEIDRFLSEACRYGKLVEASTVLRHLLDGEELTMDDSGSPFGWRLAR